ncbi:MAG: efflux RND transporter periplasmic adaptor subunit [Proteobacteria bacterium]|nr:efflux RND transporter periplasmic adaptor subunit [Pseudomonadota bacterium]
MFLNKKPIQLLFAATFVLFALAGCDKVEDDADLAKQAPPALQKVSIISTEKRFIQPKFEFPAVIEATQIASIRSQIAAIAIMNHTMPGSLVKKGELLVELDDSEFIAALSEANAALLEAKANESQATANLERAKKLKSSGHISDQEFDQIKANADVAKAQISRVQASQIRAELDMQYTKITAPFSGKISSANFSVGDFVMPSSPVQPQPLFELVKLDPVYAVSYIDLKTYNNFILKRLELKKQGIEIPPLELGIRLPNDTVYSHTGVFENWDNRAAESSGSIAARVLFDNPDGLLLPGHSVTLTGRVVDKFESIMIPQKSVSMDQQGHYVFVVENDTVARRNITVGVRDGIDWAISTGLKSGEQVIVEGVQKVRPGDKVDSVLYHH